MSARMTPEQGVAVADLLYENGDLSWELYRRARGYGQPFRAILEKAANLVSKEEVRGR